jgi:hypothetical protein
MCTTADMRLQNLGMLFFDYNKFDDKAPHHEPSIQVHVCSVLKGHHYLIVM